MPGTPRNPMNDKQTMISTAEELVRWYQQALRGAFFNKPPTLRNSSASRPWPTPSP